MTTDQSLVPIVEGEIQREPLTQRDYEAIKEALALKGRKQSHRDILIAKVLRATGLRITEFLALTPERCRQEGGDFLLLIQRKKQKHPVWERVFLPPVLGVELLDYIRGNGIRPGEKVFNLTARRVRYIFADAGRKALGRPVHPHEFRHLYTKTLIDGGLQVEHAAKMLGHADPRTTYKVYFDLTRDQRAAIQRRIPV